MSYTIANIITWAKISQALARKEAIVSRAVRSMHGDDRLPLAIYMARTSLEWMYAKNSNHESLFKVGNYVFSLCGKYMTQAMNLSQLSGGTVVTPSIATGSAIKGFRIEIKVGEGVLSAGDTSYTINYPYVISQTVMVEMPQANIPENETDQFSYSIVYSNSQVRINFTNDDGEGNNLGVQGGMLLIITGLRYTLASGTTSEPTTSDIPVTKFFTGADLDEDGKYVDSDYAGYNIIVNYLGIGVLKPSQYEALSDGGVKLLLEGEFTSEDTFTITPNGTL